MIAKMSPMRRTYMYQILVAAGYLLITPVTPYAQTEPSPSQAAPAYTQGQIDQMLAPIALYPDPLVAQILMASTYPLEVVEAQRWRKENASLQGDALATALEQQSWDPSVKALASFPQVLDMMDKNLQWTEQMGDAFLANQPAVMDSVQRLRQQAQAAGNLKNTPQQTVSTQDQDIVIAPANPQTMYVPYYNPTVVYGAWPYPDYQPYYFPPPPGYISFDEGVFGFGIGIPLIVSFWDWDHWDWHHHRIDIDNDRFRHINHDRPPIASGVWQHDPAHRHGVPYHAASVRTQFQHASEDARRSWRGYGGRATPSVGTQAEGAARASGGVTRPETIATQPAPSRATEAPRAPSAITAAPPVNAQAKEAQRVPSAITRPEAEATAVHPSAIATAPTSRRPTPVFESFSHGAEVRAQAARGLSSHSSAPAAESAHSHTNSAPSQHESGNQTNDHRH